MFRQHVRLALGVLGLLAGAAILGVVAFLLYRPETGAQIVPGSTPIPRHIVLNNAFGYRGLLWVPDADSAASRWYNYVIPCTPPVTAGYQYSSHFAAQTPVVGMAYKWGGGDFYSYSLTPAAGNKNFLERIQNSDDLAGDVNDNWHDCQQGVTDWKWTCPYARGVDCSDFVTRAWGRPVSEKWGTQYICDNSAPVPYSDRAADLPKRMRMGDVFDKCGDHVLLHYFDPVSNSPVYYEAQWAAGRGPST